MYTRTNFPTKKALKEAFKAGDKLEVFQPGGLFAGKTDGVVVIEGPHFPKPHRYYAEVIIKDSIIVKINS